MSLSSVELPSEASSSLKLFFYPKVHSKESNHRKTLRKMLFDLLLQLDPENPPPETILNLNLLPTAPDKGLSLTHSPRGSAILIDKKGDSVGVDVELTSRITERVLLRISKIHEVEAVPPEAELFTAKEAAWKALNRVRHAPTVSHIETYQWKSLKAPWHQYYVMVNGEKVPGTGFSGQFGEVSMSFFSSPSTFS